ncbi:hypothetical protein SAMN04487948_11861 [Halogranum amylolyticum]|uniref:DUF2357 domain-containing protein n=1 Tax=Halogranum amylolyticum TaxID=660520 RepID=A0A1H8VPI5_9EURY|nr:hypothetical protein [Halogranum amylolyticum]SEP17306.1 hypothetical protein SAMN04487948_11861 [Halogranum amylolyticum]
MSGSGRKIDERTAPEELLPEIAAQFSVYIGAGLEFNSVFQNAVPDLDINNLDDLLDLHFLLSGQTLDSGQSERPPDVDVGLKDFLWLLPARLRRLRTTTQRQTRVFNGEVQGRIDWQETIKARYRTGNIDDPLFACQLAEETVSIPENLVLWELLSKVLRAYEEVDEMVPEADGIEWFDEWRGDSRLVKNLDEARSNVHLSELDTEREQRDPVPNRTIRDVLESRSSLYAEAAQLLQQYRRLQNHEIDRSEAENLLKRRLFAPATNEEWSEDDAPVFFELYWVFKLLGEYEGSRRNLITKETNCIASWTDGGSKYEFYHDWTGGSEFAFGEAYFDRERNQARPGESRFLGRTADLLAIQEAESTGVFGHRRPKAKTRRPDFTLIRREDGEVKDIAIGEVKYTRNASTAASGLEELYRYMIFARETATVEPPYFTSEPNHFETPGIHGFLCVDEVDQRREPKGNVTVVEVGDTISLPF